MKIKTRLLLLIFALSGQTFAAHEHLKNVKTKADKFAWAKGESVSEASWPYAIKSIGHSMQSYQKYGFSSPYWHDGLDMRGDAGEKVYASVSGMVVNIENYYPGNALYWEVAILADNGLVWKYHHVDQNSIPQKIKEAYKNKTRIERGEYIGDIVTWPQAAFGERYHHIHMLIVDGHGKYINPFKLLPKLPDTSMPVIKEIGLFDAKRKKVSGTSVKGKHGLYVNAYDTVLHSKFNLTPYMISYKIDGGAEKLVWKFDSLPSITNDRDYIEDFYLEGTCGNYQCRDFYINLNFDATSASQATNFLELDPGSHSIEVTVSDFAGNTTSQTFEYTVR